MRNTPRTVLCLGLLTNAFATAALQAENWPQWRGPLFNGSSAETNLPVHWTKTENIAWVAPLPGRSGATPVIWGDSVFLTSPDDNKDLLLLCVDRRDGALRWKSRVGTGDIVVGKNNMASPSAVTDGKLVVAMFGTGDLAAFDFSGKQLWSRNLCDECGKFSYMFIYGASPLLYQGRLYIQVMQRNPPAYGHARDDNPERESFLLCLAPQTGKTVFKHIRQTDAVRESMEAYTTPLPYKGAGGDGIILVGGDYITSHSPETGEELWRCGGLNSRNSGNWRIITSPVAAPGFVYASGPKRDPLLAIKEGGEGSVIQAHIAWTFTEFTPDVCTPLFYMGKLFVLDGDRQVMTCLDPETGAKKWQGNLGIRETFSASPTGADGKIYCLSERGTAVVLSAGDEFKILSTIELDEGPSMSSIAVVGGQLFIRTAKNLYCVGQGR